MVVVAATEAVPSCCQTRHDGAVVPIALEERFGTYCPKLSRGVVAGVLSVVSSSPA